MSDPTTKKLLVDAILTCVNYPTYANAEHVADLIDELAKEKNLLLLQCEAELAKKDAEILSLKEDLDAYVKLVRGRDITEEEVAEWEDKILHPQ